MKEKMYIQYCCAHGANGERTLQLLNAWHSLIAAQRYLLAIGTEHIPERRHMPETRSNVTSHKTKRDQFSIYLRILTNAFSNSFHSIQTPPYRSIFHRRRCNIISFFSKSIILKLTKVTFLRFAPSETFRPILKSRYRLLNVFWSLKFCDSFLPLLFFWNFSDKRKKGRLWILLFSKRISLSLCRGWSGQRL